MRAEPQFGVRSLGASSGLEEWNLDAEGEDVTWTPLPPIAVAPFATGRAGNFAVEIGPPNDGATYTIGVRSFNASGEERN